MAQVINTNVMSLNAQRNLSTSSASMATTIQRLSSGLRINSAKDDAAGLAISQRFTTQIRGLEVAARNANDGISLAQTAEGALTEIGNNLQRIRELAVQSANATNSDTDRAALNSEVKQLLSEIDRVAKHSDFNGTKLLDGSFSGQLFQVGANSGQAIAIDKVVDARIKSLGGSSFASGTQDLSEIDASANDVKVTGTVGEAEIEVVIKKGTDTKEAAKQIASAMNAKIGESGIFASVAEDGSLSLTSVKDGVTLDADSVKLSAAAPDEDAETGWGTATPLDPFVPADAADIETVHAENIKIDTVLGAQQALSIVDNALQAINSTRADLGAIQNRFTSVVANLNTSAENLSASRSRIQDTDYAKETAELTRNQILQQAGTAMLAQAKSVPQSVLSLLQ
ncbi:flagellin [Pseudoxanthomonas sp. GW2]|jgi:Flagellin and related hook-associated proteins|uniref:flagellin n=1 Tax=Pseudoxanthomonas sp. GW2 TaxID=1211114 RepID=UPI00030721D2|nr:flagellin [Pseudoxanthomonas sp. GW2]